jgi:hypothetical protein
MPEPVVKLTRTLDYQPRENTMAVTTSGVSTCRAENAYTATTSGESPYRPSSADIAQLKERLQREAGQSVDTHLFEVYTRQEVDTAISGAKTDLTATLITALGNTFVTQVLPKILDTLVDQVRDHLEKAYLGKLQELSGRLDKLEHPM